MVVSRRHTSLRLPMAGTRGWSYAASYGELSGDDTVLEIGPGLGTLTSRLCRQAGQVVAVEFDDELAKLLPANVAELSGYA